LVHLAITSLSQERQGANWVWSSGIRIDFNQNPPLVDTFPSPIVNNGGEASNTISSKFSGELLFYTDRNKAYNSFYQQMPNGDSIFSYSGLGGTFLPGASRNSLIIQNPGNHKSNYVFGQIVSLNSTNGLANNYQIRYAKIDMSLDGNKGDISPNEKYLLLSDSTYCISALRHANGQDTWLITHSISGNTFKSFLVSDTGLSQPVISNIGLPAIPIGGSIQNLQGQTFFSIKSSPNSEYLSATIYNHTDSIWKIQLFQFNRQTGQVDSILASKDLTQESVATSFSPNSRYLFIASEYIKQYDIIQNPSLSSAIDSLNYTSLFSPFRILNMQIGLNGFLYLSSINNQFPGVPLFASKSFSVITCPDEPFALASFNNQSLDLKGRSAELEFPTLNQTFFENTSNLHIIASKPFICGYDTIELLATGGGADNFRWFPNYNISDTSVENPLIFPDTSTTYFVVSTNSCTGINDTAFIFIDVRKDAVSNLKDTLVCSNVSIIIGDTIVSGQSYFWSGPGINNTGIAFPSFNFSNLNIQPDTIQIIREVDRNGCVKIDSQKIIVFPEPEKPEIFGDFRLCPGIDSVVYFSSDSIGLPHFWSIEGGQILDTSGNSVLINWSDTSGLFSIRVNTENQYKCKSRIDSLAIILNNVLRPSISFFQDTICEFDTLARKYWSSYSNSSSSYFWQLENGSIIGSNQNDTVLIQWNGNSTGKLWLSQADTTDSDTCFGVSDTLFIEFAPKPQTQLYVANAICNGDSLIANIRGFELSSFIWKINSPYNFMSDTSILIEYISDTIDIEVLEKSIFGCTGDTLTRQVVIRPKPEPELHITDSIICSNQNLLDTILFDVDSGSNYEFLIQGGNLNEIISDSAISIYWILEQSHAITLIEKNIYGCYDTVSFENFSIDTTKIEIVKLSYDSKNDSIIHLNWTYQGDLKNEIHIQRRYDQNALWNNIDIKMAEDSFYIDLVNDPDKLIYHYRISTADACKAKVYSNSQNTILLKGRIKDDEIQLDWNPLIENYQFQNYQLLSQVDGSSIKEELIEQNYIDKDLTPAGFEYCYQILILPDSIFSNSICVYPERLIHIPNVITPNGDGYNDFLHIENLSLFRHELIIYDKWGQLVFKSNNYTNDWAPVERGIYFYELYIIDKKKSKSQYKGFIEVLK
jgi:gliding motility-associated-like protein